jgi:hypothetical protein
MRVHWLLIVLVAAILVWIVVRRLFAWLRFSWRMTCFLMFIAAVVAAVFYVQHQSSRSTERPHYQSRSDQIEFMR